jgi:hypothetical protein
LAKLANKKAQFKLKKQSEATPKRKWHENSIYHVTRSNLASREIELELEKQKEQ